LPHSATGRWLFPSTQNSDGGCERGGLTERDGIEPPRSAAIPPRPEGWGFSRKANEKTPILLAGLILFPNLVLAALNIDCRAPGSPPEEQYCADQRAQSAEWELEQVQASVIARLGFDPERIESFRKAQQAWLLFRNAECTFRTFGFEGSSLGTQISDCRAELTVERTLTLRQQLGSPTVDFEERSAYSESWYIILGSFPDTDQGRSQAHTLAQQINRAFVVHRLGIGESLFYQGLTPGLYVVTVGPFESAAAAKRNLAESGFRKLIPDAYVKQATQRQPE